MHRCNYLWGEARMQRPGHAPTRWGALALGFLMLTGGPAAATARESSGEQKTEPQKGEDLARVSVTLADAGGGQISLVDQPVRWAETATLMAKVGEHEHKVQLTLRQGDDKASVKAVLKYAKDGKTVIQEKDIGARVTEPKRVESSDGLSSVTFVVQVPRGKIEVEDSDDPLAGS
jgi:hypothetical protein